MRSAHLEDLLIDLRTLRVGSDWADAWQPLGFVDLQACPADIRIVSLPPFPLIGLGDANHPLAPALDAVVESPICGGCETVIVAKALLAPAEALTVTCPGARPYTMPLTTLATLLSLELHVTNAGAFTAAICSESPTNTFDESGLIVM